MYISCYKNHIRREIEKVVSYMWATTEIFFCVSVTGCSFVVFSAALKSSTNNLQAKASIVEGISLAYLIILY